MPQHSHVSRRDYLFRSLWGGLGWAAGSAAARCLAQSASIAEDAIDAHVHVWSPDTRQYPLSPRFSEADKVPASFTPEELFAHCRPAGVQRIVLIQMSFYEYDHSYMLEVMRGHPGVFSGVALIDFRRDGVAREVDRLVDLGMRGFRLHSRGDAASWLNAPGMAELWRRAGAVS